MTEHTITSPDAQRWVPQMVEYLTNLKKTADPAPGLARCAEMCVQLASGRYAALSGRFLLPQDDFEKLLREPAPTPGSATDPARSRRGHVDSFVAGVIRLRYYRVQFSGQARRIVNPVG